MTITLIKQQPGSWSGRARRQVALTSRISAADWDRLFDYANEHQRSTQGIVREALHDWLVQHCAERSSVRIEVSGGGSGIFKKLAQLFDGSAGGVHSAASEPTNAGECGRR